MQVNDTSAVRTPPLNRFLKIAVVAGVESAIQIHIARGDDLNARDDNGLTPLMLAAAKNRAAICKLLLGAGADESLLAPSGETAFAIATASGAFEAAAVLKSTDIPTKVLDGVVHNVSLNCADSSDRFRHSSSESLFDLNTENQIEASNTAAGTEKMLEWEDTTNFHLLSWEPEEERPPPEADTLVAENSADIQASITEYLPIDTSADWDEIDAYLPERSLPLARNNDAEARERLRLLILRAVREGSVPSMSVEEVATNDDGSANPETEALLNMVINDLGAEVDERFEYTSIDENFEVFTIPEEKLGEEDLVADALTFVENLASRHSEPLRIYQKEFQREKLISAAEEVSLCQAMEINLEQALDALAAWPLGIELTLAAGNLVKTKQRSITWLSIGSVDMQVSIENKTLEEITLAERSNEEVEFDDDFEFNINGSIDDHASDFFHLLIRLEGLPHSSIQQGENWQAIRGALASLKLNRRFLLELADIAGKGKIESEVRYAYAMNAYQQARERMATANLKLVFHLAKKYQYSGEPLDDLAQEGNIGLLKAVERFDWRRGFKFSTYATWWIRQQIGRHVADKCRTIRIPVHLYEKAQRLSRGIQTFELESGRTPSLEEITTRLDIPIRVIKILQGLEANPLPIHDIFVDELIAVDAASDFASLDPFDILSKSELRETIDKVLSTLKQKEEKILRLRYGIGTTEALTLDEVGQRYEVTRERIRQIEASAIRKLMHPSRMEILSRAFFGSVLELETLEKDAEIDSVERSKTIDSESQPVAIDFPSLNLETRRPEQSLNVDRLLTQAEELGVPILDDRGGSSGRVWINLTDIQDGRYRRLARKLLASGFEFWPGKGYWK